MSDATASLIGDAGTVPNIVREAVGVFDTSAQLEMAIDHLSLAGIDRGMMSVLGAKTRKPHEPGERENEAAPRSILEISDDPRTPTTAFVSDASWSEARGMATAVPLVIGGFGGAWAVAAAGGALLVAIGATVASGAVGAGLGALLFHAVARRHAAAISEQMTQGGLILWVRAADQAAEKRALAVLQECGAGFAHTHLIDRPWGVEDSPLHGVQPDPFLEHAPSIDAV